MKRGRIAVFCLALLVLAAGPVLAEGAKEAAEKKVEKATLRLNWRRTGQHAMYYVGVIKGYYKEEGVDLEIKEGTGTVPAAQMAANKSDTFALVNPAAIIPHVEKGMPIKCIGMIAPKTTNSVIFRKDSGITSFKDLKGKKVATTAGDALTQQWPAVLGASGLTDKDVELVYVDAAAKVPVVLERRADALLGSAADQFFLLQGQGVQAGYINFAEVGVNVLNMAVWTHEDMLKSNPELIRKFLRGLKRSIEDYRKDPEAAARLLVKMAPNLDVNVTISQAVANLDYLYSPSDPKTPLLMSNPNDWIVTADILKRYAGQLLKMKPEDYYTNEFVPK